MPFLEVELWHSYTQATQAFYVSTALTGLSKNAALATLGPASGAIQLLKIIALDQTDYTITRIWLGGPAGTAVIGGPTWTAASTALTGLSKNIALGGPYPGWYTPNKSAALRIFSGDGATVAGIGIFYRAGYCSAVSLQSPAQGAALAEGYCTAKPKVIGSAQGVAVQAGYIKAGVKIMATAQGGAVVQGWAVVTLQSDPTTDLQGTDTQQATTPNFTF